MRPRVPFLLVILLLLTNVATGATISVRKDGAGDYAVIQEALDVAAAGDTILIGPGQYVWRTLVHTPPIGPFMEDLRRWCATPSPNLICVGRVGAKIVASRAALIGTDPAM